jgi:ribosomal protein S21
MMLELQERSHYKKPSELRREKKALGRLRAQKQTREGNKSSGIYF